MDRLKPSPPMVVALLALLALFLALAGGAFALPGDGGTFTGCVGDRGVLRVVDDASACIAGETPISWNQTGQPGPIGAQGAPGPPGATGPTGGRGARGANGTLLVGGNKNQSTIKLPSLLQQVYARLGVTNSRLAKIDFKLTTLNAKADKAEALSKRAYERIYHVCLGVESSKGLPGTGPTPAVIGVTRCKFGFYNGWAGYNPEP